MSGVYISGMEMPTKCADCLFIDYFKGQWYCHSINDILETGSSKRDERCNLVHFPPHGDLIDRREAIIDANERAYDFWLSDDEVNATIQFLKEQPTVIPEEEG